MPDPTITMSDILEASAGRLRKQLYVVFTRAANGLGPIMANIEPHLKFQDELESKGIMFGAGPLWNLGEDNWEGEGMVIIRAESAAEADKIAASDPMHQSGARTYTIRPWLLNEGTLTVKLTYSDGKREII